MNISSGKQKNQNIKVLNTEERFSGTSLLFPNNTLRFPLRMVKHFVEVSKQNHFYWRTVQSSTHVALDFRGATEDLQY